MSAIAIRDLSINRALDRQALASIRGGGAPWVYGWIRPYVAPRPSFGATVNYYQISNTFIADQMVNQFQVIDVTNTGNGAVIGVGVGADGAALKQ